MTLVNRKSNSEEKNQHKVQYLIEN